MRISSPNRIIYLTVFLLLSILSLGAQAVEYDSQGKRDPFMSLLKIAQRPEPPKIVGPPPLEQRPPGLAGLLISEVTVMGHASGPEVELVILKGIDDVSYFAREGSKLFDGYVDEIRQEEVVFVRERVDTVGKKHISRVTKRIQTEDH